MTRLFQTRPGLFIAAAALILGLGLVPETSHTQEIRDLAHLPLQQTVQVPPSPVQAEGRIHLFWELHLANHFKRPLELVRLSVLDGEGNAVKEYAEQTLQQVITRPGVAGELDQPLSIDGGCFAVLFLMASFDQAATMPQELVHEVTVKLARANGEVSLLRSRGQPVAVADTEQVVVGPPVRGGRWLVANGPGDGPVGHRDSMQVWNGQLVTSQRYALDLMRFGDDRRLVGAEPERNKSWHSYGNEVIAVADGVVTAVKDGVIENVPLVAERATPNTIEYATGNYVIVHMGHGRYAVYAHLQPGSLRVALGEAVRKGQALGLIGNSGNSDAPHLHLHIGTHNAVFDTEGLPFAFESFSSLGRFENLDENLAQPWQPSSEAVQRHHELPLGDSVILFDDMQ